MLLNIVRYDDFILVFYFTFLRHNYSKYKLESWIFMGNFLLSRWQHLIKNVLKPCEPIYLKAEFGLDSMS